MEQNAHVAFKVELGVAVNGEDWGNPDSLGFWKHAFRWNLRRRAWRALAHNLRVLPRYLLKGV